MAAIDLIVLGMIKAQPQSAYELQKNVEYRNISKWVKVSTPSIYKKVVQLEEKGDIAGSVVKEGKMPEKTVYRITEAGEKHFLKLMEETAGQSVRLFLDFNAVIMSLDFVPEELRGGLTGRIQDEIQIMKDTVEEKMSERSHAPFTGMAILEQQYMLFDVLGKWMENFRKDYLK